MHSCRYMKFHMLIVVHIIIVNIFGSMSNNVGDNLNQQNILNYAAASIANL